MHSVQLLEINPALDLAGLTAAFSAQGRVQIRNVLTPQSAQALAKILAHGTPWDMVWQAGPDGPHRVDNSMLSQTSRAQRQQILADLTEAMRCKDYAFSYAQYRFLENYRSQRDPGGPHDMIFEQINSEPFLRLARSVSAIESIRKADAQGTLYAPGNFLSAHDDQDEQGGRRIAYVLNLCTAAWRPDWGGYLNFLDDDGDIVAGYRPRFNALNLFAVPMLHNVSYVPPFAPVERYAITGWFRDR